MQIKIGVVGFGNFSRLMVPILARFAEVSVYVRPGKETALAEEVVEMRNVQVGKEEDVTGLAYLIFSVPLDGLEEACARFQSLVGKETVIIDVLSVKVRAVEMLKKYFPKSQIIGTHPIFGPQSARDGLAGLPVVLCNISASDDSYEEVRMFCQEKLSLAVHEMTPEEHDHEMAHVQGITHMIGRALILLGAKKYPITTKSYDQLLELTRLIGDDSLELYKTIQNGNPYAKEEREKFLRALAQLEKQIEE